MNRVAGIKIRFDEVYLHGRWIANTNYHDQLSQVDFKVAIHKLGELNSIAALTFHICYYLKGLLSAFETQILSIQDQYSYDLPALTGAEEWEALRSDLFVQAQLFSNYLAGLQDEDLNQPFIDPKYGSLEKNLDAIIEHSYYHLGQIVLLRKMIGHAQTYFINLAGK